MQTFYPSREPNCFLQKPPDCVILCKPQAFNAMHIEKAAHFWKLFARLIFCMVAFRFSKDGKKYVPEKKSAPPEALTAIRRARRPALRAAIANETHQSNVIRIHTDQRPPFSSTGWPPVRPSTGRPFTSPPGSPRQATEKNALAENCRLLLGRRHLEVFSAQRQLRFHGGFDPFVRAA